MNLEDYDISNKITARVIDSHPLTSTEASEEIKEITLEIQDSSFDVHIGQSIAIIIQGPHEFGHQHHIRLYTIAGKLQSKEGKYTLILICVKRINYLDEYSGELQQGIASNYLCNLANEATVEIAGPYGLPFKVPTDKTSNFVLIGLGTGIAPFRAFVKHLYEDIGDWQGEIRLYYGARSGLESVYLNDERDDFSQYYDKETFNAFKALSPRPAWNDPIAFDQILLHHQQRVWDLINNPKTYVYLAGFHDIEENLEKCFVTMAGSEDLWLKTKSDLIKENRWVELSYGLHGSIA